MRKGNPHYDFAKGTIEPPRSRVSARKYNITVPYRHTGMNYEVHIDSIEKTDAYEKRPQVRSDAAQLHENLLLSEFPDDPLPMPSPALMALLYEFSSVKSKLQPHVVYSMHPSALLALGIAANERLKKEMMPLVMEHVNRVLDEEEKTGVEDPQHYNDPNVLYATVFDDVEEEEEEDLAFPPEEEEIDADKEGSGAGSS